MKEKIQALQKMVDESSHIVFFGGAGASTESGIPDFRSVDGLYNQSYKYPPETILSRSFFDNNPEEFYRFYRNKMICLEAKPNFAHEFLVNLEKQEKLRAIVTQNIDNLHYMAGSKTVYELHGNVHRNYCMRCGKAYSIEKIIDTKEKVPHCTCGGIIKPDVVLYEEGLDSATIDGAVNSIKEADMLIIAGTSLNVYPAASFIQYFRGKYLVVINKSELTVRADLVIQAAVGEVFRKIM